MTGWQHIEYSATVTKKCYLYTMQHPAIDCRRLSHEKKWNMSHEEISYIDI